MGAATRRRLCVVGLGKLGSPFAAVLAAKGHTVVGVDLDERAVRMLGEGSAPVDEPGLQALLDKREGRLAATTDIAVAVRASELTFIVVPTPSEAGGGFSLRYVLDAVQSVGEALGDGGSQRHVVVVSSTVMPGSTSGPLREALERASGRVVGASVGLCYSPMFIALGTVIQDITHPDLVLIGESDAASGELVAEVVGAIVETAPAVARMAPVNAELTKLAVNTFVTTKISYANMLGEICEGIPEADADVVTRAVGLDSRIGAKYLRAGTAYGGPCFPRDNGALAAAARLSGGRADLAEATDAINLRQLDRLADRALGALSAGGRLGILGLTYKPGTSVVVEAAGLGLAQMVIARGHAPVVYDPEGLENARAVLGEAAAYAESAAACVASADVVVMVTPWPEFGRLSAADFGGRRRTLIDCWRMFDAADLAAVADVVHLGIGPAPEAVRR
jgi:UDPglucose 6-dehydrogenase